MTSTEEALYNALIECQKYFRNERENTDGDLEAHIASALRTANKARHVPGQTFLF